MISDSSKSTNEVMTPLPRSFHELPTLRSAAFEGASLNTCSEYRAISWSRPVSSLVKMFVVTPDRTCETASRLAPHELQTFRSFGFSRPQVGQNIIAPQTHAASTVTTTVRSRGPFASTRSTL